MATLVESPPAPARLGRRETLTLAAMCLGAMMTFLQITASASALSAIKDDLHVSPTELVWIPSSYTLLVASLVLSAGTLGNLYGRRKLFAIGALVMMAGSLTVVFAGGTGLVIAGQLISGVGGALILPNSLAILGATFPDPHRRTEVVTAWAASSGIGLAVGPLIAGVLLNHFSWHAVFASTVVLGALTLAVTARWVAESRQPGGRLDVAGLVLGTTTIAGLVYALIQGGHDGYGSGRILVAWGIAVLAGIAFVVVERRQAAPMLDIRLFSSRSFSAVNLVAAVSLFGFTGVAILSVLFYQQVQGLSALDTGWRLLTLFGVYVVAAFLAGRAIRRTGFKAPLTVGLTLGGLACLGLLTQGPATGFAHVWPLYALFGAACGLVVAPSTAAALVSVAPAQGGMASGIVNTTRQVGSVMGTSLLGTILTSQLAQQLPTQLAAHGVPERSRPAIESAVATGSTASISDSARAAIADAFTSGMHRGLLVVGVAFLCSAVVALAFVRNRPHATR